MQKLELLNLEAKMPHLGVLGSNFEKQLSHLKSAIYLLTKLGAKNKNPLTWGQKYQIYVFWSSNLNILLSYLKSTPSNLSN